MRLISSSPTPSITNTWLVVLEMNVEVLPIETAIVVPNWLKLLRSSWLHKIVLPYCLLTPHQDLPSQHHEVLEAAQLFNPHQLQGVTSYLQLPLLRLSTPFPMMPKNLPLTLQILKILLFLLMLFCLMCSPLLSQMMISPINGISIIRRVFTRFALPLQLQPFPPALHVGVNTLSATVLSFRTCLSFGITTSAGVSTCVGNKQLGPLPILLLLLYHLHLVKPPESVIWMLLCVVTLPMMTALMKLRIFSWAGLKLGSPQPFSSFFCQATFLRDNQGDVI